MSKGLDMTKFGGLVLVLEGTTIHITTPLIFESQKCGLSVSWIHRCCSLVLNLQMHEEFHYFLGHTGFAFLCSPADQQIA